MKIFLEGCDGVGKTTLAKLLANKYNLDICHCTQNDPNNFEFYYETSRKENIIWDRHFLGELIYPSIFNRKQNLTINEAKLITKSIKNNNGHIYVLTCDNDIILKRLKERNKKESLDILNSYQKINELFILYANYLKIPIIDTSKMSLKSLKEIIDTLKEAL